MTYAVFVATGTESNDDCGLRIVTVEAATQDEARAQVDMPVVMVVEAI